MGLSENQINELARILTSKRPEKLHFEIAGTPINIRRIQDSNFKVFGSDAYKTKLKGFNYEVVEGLSKPFSFGLTLYRTDKIHHWRLFSYHSTNMTSILMSVNFSTKEEKEYIIKHNVRFENYPNISPSYEVARWRAIYALKNVNFTVVPSITKHGAIGKDVELKLGRYNPKRKACFQGVSPEKFIENFIKAALIIGHFREKKIKINSLSNLTKHIRTQGNKLDLMRKVYFSQDAYTSIIVSAAEVYNKECMGMLAGVKTYSEMTGEEFRIEYAIPFQSTKRKSTSVSCSQKSINSHQQILKSIRPDLEICGYYHSHPSNKNEFISLCPSDEDLLSMQNNYLEVIIGIKKSSQKKQPECINTNGAITSRYGDFIMAFRPLYKNADGFIEPCAAEIISLTNLQKFNN